MVFDTTRQNDLDYLDCEGRPTPMSCTAKGTNGDPEKRQREMF